MRESSRRRVVALALTMLLAGTAAELPALSFISIEAGRMLLGNPSDGVGEGDVSPWLVTAGASVPVVELGAFRFEIGALVWETGYEYLAAEGRMVPTQLETAHQVTTLGLWVSPRAGVHVLLAGGAIELGAAAGLSLNFRFPLRETDLQAGAQPTSLVAGYRYFWAGRFLFPETRLWVRWNAFDDFALSLSLAALYPLFHVWDGGAFADQFIFAAIAGFDVRLPQRKTQPLQAGGNP
jgi:hypothetical protein